jgi:hypothetical protein
MPSTTPNNDQKEIKVSIANTIQNKLAAINLALFPELPKKLHNQRKEIDAMREFRIAYEMRGYANKRFDVAKEAMENLHLADGFNSMKPGMSKVLWQDDTMVLTGSVNNPVVGTDVTKLKSKLIVELGQVTADKLFKECEKIARPARKYNFADL